MNNNWLPRVPKWIRWLPWMKAIDDIGISNFLSKEEVSSLPPVLQNDPWFWFFLKPILLFCIIVVILPDKTASFVSQLLDIPYQCALHIWWNRWYVWIDCWKWTILSYLLFLVWLWWLIKVHIRNKKNS